MTVERSPEPGLRGPREGEAHHYCRPGRGLLVPRRCPGRDDQGLSGPKSSGRDDHGTGLDDIEDATAERVGSYDHRRPEESARPWCMSVTVWPRRARCETTGRRGGPREHAASLRTVAASEPEVYRSILHRVARWGRRDTRRPGRAPERPLRSGVCLVRDGAGPRHRRAGRITPSARRRGSCPPSVRARDHGRASPAAGSADAGRARFPTPP